MTKEGIALIVGLGNPGNQYAETRHNIGQWFIQALAETGDVTLQNNNKCLGQLGQYKHNNHQARLLIPAAFMNLSGQAVAATSAYFNITPETILVVHDDIDLKIGTVKIKAGGGHGGHNGLRDIHQQLGTDRYHRLRFGVGHPGHKSKVHDYVLNPPPIDERIELDRAIARALAIIPLLLSGQHQQAIQQLHTAIGE